MDIDVFFDQVFKQITSSVSRTQITPNLSNSYIIFISFLDYLIPNKRIFKGIAQSEFKSIIDFFQVLCVFGGWCDGEGPRAAAQIFNPCANSWTLWTDEGCQTQGPQYEWLDQLAPDDAKNPISITGPEGASQQTIDDQINSSTNRIPTLPIGLYKTPEQLINANDVSCLIGEIPRRVYAGCVLVGNRVYLVGGFDGTNALKSTLCYDFELDSGW